jgi:hypothetical protein
MELLPIEMCEIKEALHRKKKIMERINQTGIE